MSSTSRKDEYCGSVLVHTDVSFSAHDDFLVFTLFSIHLVASALFSNGNLGVHRPFLTDF